MEIRFEKACTGQYSIIHAESVIRTEFEFFLVGKIENSEYEESDLSDNEDRVVGVIQDKENPELFYMYETIINLEKLEEDEVEYTRGEINAKIKYYLNAGDEVFPWVSKFGDSIMIPNGTMGPIDISEELPFLAGAMGPEEEITIYKRISDDVKYPDL